MLPFITCIGAIRAGDYEKKAVQGISARVEKPCREPEARFGPSETHSAPLRVARRGEWNTVA